MNCKRAPEIENELNSKETNLSEMKSELSELIRNTDFNYIPSKYRTRQALDYIYQVMSRGKAKDLNQAIDVYEEALQKAREQMIREEQLEMQRRQIQLQEEQNEIARTWMMNEKSDRDAERRADMAASLIGTAITAGVVLKAGKEIVKALKDL